MADPHGLPLAAFHHDLRVIELVCHNRGGQRHIVFPCKMFLTVLDHGRIRKMHVQEEFEIRVRYHIGNILQLLVSETSPSPANHHCSPPWQSIIDRHSIHTQIKRLINIVGKIAAKTSKSGSCIDGENVCKMKFQ